jgi:DNA-binding transcriptional ArsR family regulator
VATVDRVIERREATPDQIKAVANPLRLRILRLCNDREWTNKELADRLDRDPSTILHHLRLLVDAGLVEPVGVRQGPSGAYEKPYRSTGLSWRLSFERPVEDDEGDLAMLAAFRHELAEAGNDSVAQMARFHLHIDEEAVRELDERFVALIDEYLVDDDARRQRGLPGYGGFIVVHRLAGGSGGGDADSGGS